MANLLLTMGLDVDASSSRQKSILRVKTALFPMPLVIASSAEDQLLLRRHESPHQPTWTRLQHLQVGLRSLSVSMPGLTHPCFTRTNLLNLHRSRWYFH